MIVARYLRFLCQQSDGLSGSPQSNFVIQIGLPAVVSLAFLHCGFGIGNVGGLATCVSIISAMMCAISVLLFQTRMRDVQEDRRLTRTDFCFVDNLFTLSEWAMVIGLLLVLLIAAPDFLCVSERSWLVKVGEIFSDAYCYLVFFLIVHLIAVVLVFMNRFAKVYERIAEKGGANDV